MYYSNVEAHFFPFFTIMRKKKDTTNIKFKSKCCLLMHIQTIEQTSLKLALCFHEINLTCLSQRESTGSMVLWWARMAARLASKAADRKTRIQVLPSFSLASAIGYRYNSVRAQDIHGNTVTMTQLNNWSLLFILTNCVAHHKCLIYIQTSSHLQICKALLDESLLDIPAHYLLVHCLLPYTRSHLLL